LLHLSKAQSRHSSASAELHRIVESGPSMGGMAGRSQ
jgi:hypothetical protein